MPATKKPTLASVIRWLQREAKLTQRNTETAAPAQSMYLYGMSTAYAIAIRELRAIAPPARKAAATDTLCSGRGTAVGEG